MEGDDGKYPKSDVVNIKGWIDGVELNIGIDFSCWFSSLFTESHGRNIDFVVGDEDSNLIDGTIGTVILTIYVLLYTMLTLQVQVAN